MRRLIVVLAVVGGLVACEKTEYVEQQDAGVQQDAAQEDAAPCGPDTYPCPPYGAVPGSIIENVTFNGWMDDNGDGDLLNDPYRSWGLDYFYQLARSGGANYLLVNGSAGWCYYCKQENAVLQEMATEYASQGILFAEFLFEDASYDPATKEFAQSWVATYDLAIPVGVDATFKMGRYFDAAVSPANIIIALRDITFYGAPIKAMQIVEISTGFSRDGLEAILDDLAANSE